MLGKAFKIISIVQALKQGLWFARIISTLTVSDRHCDSYPQLFHLTRSPLVVLWLPLPFRRLKINFVASIFPNKTTASDKYKGS